MSLRPRPATNSRMLSAGAVTLYVQTQALPAEPVLPRFVPFAAVSRGYTPPTTIAPLDLLLRVLWIGFGVGLCAGYLLIAFGGRA